ncbi:hypothetical protein LTR66_000223 [Elasticomyces elasticus]|nr:hypothetical protein LTR66_000223 [Elasticomyces elasticus]KAK5008235.1 hypothetical protein LTR28_004258 [Elasticomyces elasticus]
MYGLGLGEQLSKYLHTRQHGNCCTIATSDFFTLPKGNAVSLIGSVPSPSTPAAAQFSAAAAPSLGSPSTETAAPTTSAAAATSSAASSPASSPAAQTAASSPTASAASPTAKLSASSSSINNPSSSSTNSPLSSATKNPSSSSTNNPPSSASSSTITSVVSGSAGVSTVFVLTAVGSPTSTPTTQPTPQKSTNLGAVIGGAVGGGAVIALVILALWYRRRMRRSRDQHSYSPHTDLPQMTSSNEPFAAAAAAGEQTPELDSRPTTARQKRSLWKGTPELAGDSPRNSARKEHMSPTDSTGTAPPAYSPDTGRRQGGYEEGTEPHAQELWGGYIPYRSPVAELPDRRLS